MLKFLGILLADALLTGSVIGSSPSVDYSSNQATTTTNLPSAAFDGNLQTYYASYQRSYAYVGLDLGQPHVITKVGWSPRNDGLGPKRTCLAVFEGSNRSDFLDAIPIYMTDEQGTIGVMSYADVHCSRAFRYVRYVGPGDSRCNVAEVAFYGHPGPGDDSQLYRPTNLPCVVISTNNQQEPYDKEHELPGIVSILGSDGSLLQDSAYTRLRGNASKDFPKKPYRIKFANKHKVLDAPANAKKWTLINNYGDKTLMRNLLAFHLSQLLEMPYTPYGRPVDVILNGEYKGCYQLCDQIEVRKNRVDIEEITPTNNTMPEQSGGYLLEVDAYADQEPQGSWFRSNNANPVTIKAPSSEYITNTQNNYIRGVFNTMETAVMSGNWRRYLDEQTFLRHFLVGELSGNTDTYWSVYMYKHRDNDTLFVGPVWDFDLAFENDNRTYPILSRCGNRYVYASYGSYAGNMRTFVNRIVEQDQQAKNEMSRIWSVARDKGLTAAHLLNYIDSLAEEINDSQRLNFLRWDILNSQVHMNPQAAGSYQGEVNIVKNYIRQRLSWMDNKVGYKVGTWSDLESTPSVNDNKFCIYNLQGTLIYEGTEWPDLGGNSIYIVRQADKTYKILTK